MRFSMRPGRKSACGALVLALLLAALPAFAAEVTRDSYREAVEPICKSNKEASDKYLSGVRRMVKGGKLKQASVHLSKAAKALRKTISELEAVAKPPADQARLTKWLHLVATEASLFEKAAKQLKAGNKIGAEKSVLRLNHNANQANNIAAPFEFRYCRFEPSKYT